MTGPWDPAISSAILNKPGPAQLRPCLGVYTSHRASSGSVSYFGHARDRDLET